MFRVERKQMSKALSNGCFEIGMHAWFLEIIHSVYSQSERPSKDCASFGRLTLAYFDFFRPIWHRQIPIGLQELGVRWFWVVVFGFLFAYRAFGKHLVSFCEKKLDGYPWGDSLYNSCAVGFCAHPLLQSGFSQRTFPSTRLRIPRIPQPWALVFWEIVGAHHASHTSFLSVF